MLAAVIAFAIERIRGDKPGLVAVGTKALRFLPKNFLCYVFVLVSGAVLVFVPPGLIFVPFLIWAPGFIAAEMFAREQKTGRG